MFFMFCIFVEGVVALFLLVYCKFEMRVILNVILNSNTCFVSPDRLTRTRTHLTLLDKTIQCIVNPEFSVKRTGCTAFKRNTNQIWPYGFLDHPWKTRCGAICRSFKICVPIPSPPSAGAGVFFAGTYAQMLTKFPFYTLDKKSPRFVWFARDFYEFSAWASDSCSFVLKKVRSADSATAVVVQGLEGKWWDGCMLPCASFAARAGSGGSTCWVGFAIRTYHTFATECLGRLYLATASWAVIGWLASAWQPWGSVVFMSFQLSLLRGKPGRAYSKKNHQINGVDPSARSRLKWWHSMIQNLQAAVLAHLTGDSIKQVWCCFFPGLSSTTSLKQFHVSRLGKIVIQFYQVLGLWNGWPWVALNYINFISTELCAWYEKTSGEGVQLPQLRCQLNGQTKKLPHPKELIRVI